MPSYDTYYQVETPCCRIAEVLWAERDSIKERYEDFRNSEGNGILDEGDFIQIKEAEKIMNGRTEYVVYIILFGDFEVRRRYSEFEQLRTTLVKFYPCLLIPPIPNKHTLTQYATKQNRAKDDVTIIAKRKRMLQTFLNRLAKHAILVSDHVFHRFLDKNTNWAEVLLSLPSSAPKKPVSEISLTINGEPTSDQDISSSKIKAGEDEIKFTNSNQFDHAEQFTLHVQSVLAGPLVRTEKSLIKKLTDLSKDLCELGALYNGFSLTESAPLSQAVEKAGQAADVSFMSSTNLTQALEEKLSEPLEEYVKYSDITYQAIHSYITRHGSLGRLVSQLNQKKEALKQLEVGELESKRLEAALQKEIEARDPYSDDESLYPEDELRNHPNLPRSSRSRSNSYLSNKSLNLNPPNNDNLNPNHHNNLNPDQNGFEEQSLDTPTNKPTSNLLEVPGAPVKHNTTTDVNSIDPSVSPPQPPPSRGISGTNLLGLLSHTLHGLIDVDPEASRRSSITKTKEQISSLREQCYTLQASLSSEAQELQTELNRFQTQKVMDFHRLMIGVARAHTAWCQENLKVWEEALHAAKQIPSNRKTEPKILPISSKDDDALTHTELQEDIEGDTNDKVDKLSPSQ